LDVFATTVDGFKAAMTELGYRKGRNIVYDLQRTNFEAVAEERILRKFVADGVDMMLVFPSEISVAAKRITQGTNIPMVFCQTNIEGTDLPRIKCRSQQIQQVLMNLMINARDALNERYPGHSPEKKPRVFARLTERQPRRYIRLTVEDSDKGIPAQIRNRIFDPFFTTKPKETGTGLGLSISYGIVRDHGGQLSVESEPGRCTRFHVDLPVDNGWTLTGKRSS
jgi:signal transduction histidine kinase